MLHKKLPLYYLFISISLGSIISFFTFWGSPVSQFSSSSQVILNPTANIGNNNYRFSRMKGYKLTQPLLWAKPIAESKEYRILKEQISGLVKEEQKSKQIASASVYLMSLADGSWASVNSVDSFFPGTLEKLPLLITYLRESETNPRLMTKKMVYDGQLAHTGNNGSKIMEPGHSYTIEELLHFMIASSDKVAFEMLEKNLDINSLKKTYLDLKIPRADPNNPSYQINAKRYSRFFMVLYNASYLSVKSSEYALELLAGQNNKVELEHELSGSVKMANETGEWYDDQAKIYELHESGIVYCNSKPYLLTIMTRGANNNDLGGLINKISRLVYDNITTEGNAQLTASK